MSGKHWRDHIWEQLRRMERREFLRMAASSALAASGVLGCGSSTTGNDDGDNDGNNGNNDGNNDGITPAQRSASIKGIIDKINAIANQPRDARMAMMLDYVKSRPEIIGRGMNADGVWAIYPDGTPLMILDNRDPEDEPLPDELPPLSPALSGTEVPASIRARFINTMGTAFPNVVTRFTPLVAARGYSIVPDPGTIESLALAGGDGIFYMSAHGGVVVIPDLDSSGNVQVDAQGNATGLRDSYAIWTASPYVPENPNEYRTSITAGQVGIGIARFNRIISGQVDEFAPHYWITPQFVLQRMNNFGENSLVWFGACSSNSSDSAAFVAACLAKKPGLYVGWTNATNAGAMIASGRFILDRLLGSNTTNPKETPPQRPFDYEQVWDDLRQHGLHRHYVRPRDPSDLRTTDIVYTAGASRFGLLAPSLEYVLINEYDDQAVLKGIFGKPQPSQRAVLIGGLEATVVSWDEDKIVCNLPRSGTGSAGDVVVWVRGHDSNVRRITEWNIPLHYWFKHPEKQALQVSGDGFVRFRADVGEYREAAHDAPLMPLRSAVATRDSDLSLTASGSVVTGDCTESWLGQQVFPASGYGAVDRMLVARFKVDTDTKKGAIGLAFGALPPMPFTYRIACPPPIGTSEGELAVSFGQLYGLDSFPDPDPGEQNRPPVPLFAVQLDLGPDYGFPGGWVEELGIIRLEWDSVTPTYPPDPQAARVPGAAAPIPA